MLKYGCNPNQKPSKIFMKDGRAAHHRIKRQAWIYQLFWMLSTAWQLVKRAESRPLDCRQPLPLSTSAQPARAVGTPLTDTLKQDLFCGRYGRAFSSGLRLRQGQRRGPHVLLRRFYRLVATCATCPPLRLSQREVSDGIIAPGYTGEALEILKIQTEGQLQRCSNRSRTTSPLPVEHKDVYGVTFEQGQQ